MGSQPDGTCVLLVPRGPQHHCRHCPADTQGLTPLGALWPLQPCPPPAEAQEVPGAVCGDDGGGQARAPRRGHPGLPGPGGQQASGADAGPAPAPAPTPPASPGWEGERPSARLHLRQHPRLIRLFHAQAHTVLICSPAGLARPHPRGAHLGRMGRRRGSLCCPARLSYQAKARAGGPAASPPPSLRPTPAGSLWSHAHLQGIWARR